MPLTAGSYCPHASETKEAAMKEHKVLLAILVLILILSTYWITNARAEDWQGSPFAGRADKQEVMPAVRERLSGQVKCCNQAEIVKTQFRVSRTQDEDQWFYLTKENKWKRIPPDIFHPLEEDTPTHQPVLFIWADTEVCFWVGGIDG